jgi:hypothetical protein
MKSEYKWLVILAAAMFALCALPGCSKKSAPVDSSHAKRSGEDTGFTLESVDDHIHLLQTEENTKYGLAVLYYGEVYHWENGTHTNLIEYLTIKDLQHGTEIRYSPIDPSSLDDPHGYFSGVWSPDKELLALPLGRWEGFGIMRSSEVTKRIAKGRFNDTIRVKVKDEFGGTCLWHEFSGWKSPTSFDFTAGLDTGIPFSYSVPDHRLTVREKLNDNFVGVNSKGKIPIAH